MRTINADQMERERTGAVVIDVLPEESFERAHLPGAVNIPVGDEDFLERVADEAPTKDTKIIVYCADEACQASPKAAKKLEGAGYTNIVDFEGGLKGWRQAGHGLLGEREQVADVR